MGALVRRHPLIAALLALCALLVVVIGVEVGLGSVGTSATAPGPIKAATVDAKLLPPIEKTPPEQAFPETATRPLFVPTRRPAPAATVVATMVKGQFVLHGVTMVGDTRIAMLKDKSGKTHRVEKGKEINGVTVAEVEAERVTLKVGDDQETLALLVHKATGEAIPATASQPGPFPIAAQPAAGAAPAAGAVPAGAVPATLTPGGRPAPGAPARGPNLPTPAQPAGTGVAPAGAPAVTTPAPAMTPEEVMARRRAQRAQPQ